MKKFLIFLAMLLLPCSVWAIQGGPKKANLVNVTMTTANTEVSTTIPNGVSGLKIQSRTAADFKLGLTSNQSGSTFYTVKSGAVLTQDSLNLDYSPTSPYTTLYFQSANAGQIVEIIYFQ